MFGQLLVLLNVDEWPDFVYVGRQQSSFFHIELSLTSLLRAYDCCKRISVIGCGGMSFPNSGSLSSGPNRSKLLSSSQVSTITWRLATLDDCDFCSKCYRESGKALKELLFLLKLRMRWRVPNKSKSDGTLNRLVPSAPGSSDKKKQDSRHLQNWVYRWL